MNHFMQFGSEKDLDVAAEIAEILFALSYGGEVGQAVD